MNAPRIISRRPRGNSLTPVLLVVGALSVSGAVFFLFTRKQIEKAQAERAAAENAAPQAAAGDKPALQTAGSAQPSATAPAPATTTPGTPAPTPAPAPMPKPVAPAKPAEVGAQVLRQIAAGDFAGASKMLVPDEAGAAQLRGVLEKVTGDLGFKPGDPSKVQILGQVDNIMRIALPFASPVAGAPPARIILDLQKDGNGGWKVAQLHLPKELEPALAAMPQNVKVASPAALAVGTPALPAPGAPASTTTVVSVKPAGAASKPLIVVDREPDALTFASDFVHALLKPDYIGARSFVDQEKVAPVKLAALCIVFEEGGYRLADEKPLMSTVATDVSSWVIARVKSESQQQQTEFGLEMEKSGDQWRVGGLNLSKLLSDNAKDSSIAGVPYTPLVQNPKGGESIALFYEYDRAELHPRAQKQLDIVVQILRNSPQKKLRISGFTDALGSDAYNLNLSRSRAEAVKEYILSKGVPLAQVETTGFGKALPLSPNVKADGSDNPEGRSRNRRAEILLDF